MRQIHAKGSHFDLLARIREVSAWEGETDYSAQTMQYAPGVIGISRKFGKLLMDIGTGRKDSASCVTIVAIEGIDGVVQGPGLVTAHLEIDEFFDQAPVDHPCLWIGGDPIESERIRQRKKGYAPKNCKGYFYYR